MLCTLTLYSVLYSLYTSVRLHVYILAYTCIPTLTCTHIHKTQTQTQTQAQAQAQTQTQTHAIMLEPTRTHCICICCAWAVVETMDYFRAVVQVNEISLRALKLTHDVIAANSANYTAW